MSTIFLVHIFYTIFQFDAQFFNYVNLDLNLLMSRKFNSRCYLLNKNFRNKKLVYCHINEN